ncbi:MAG: hypothetical protein P4M11_02355 [Candidatus Pacebacteria bacterium]|nr:hypothetical protein [Candidatus Paceibacterota bacterium]
MSKKTASAFHPVSVVKLHGMSFPGKPPLPPPSPRTKVSGSLYLSLPKSPSRKSAFTEADRTPTQKLLSQSFTPRASDDRSRTRNLPKSFSQHTAETSSSLILSASKTDENVKVVVRLRPLSSRVSSSLLTIQP